MAQRLPSIYIQSLAFIFSPGNKNLKDTLWQARATGESVTHMPRKHEDLNLDLQHPHQSWSWEQVSVTVTTGSRSSPASDVRQIVKLFSERP